MSQTLRSAKPTLRTVKETLRSAKLTLPTMKETLPSAKLALLTVSETLRSAKLTLRTVKETLRSAKSALRSVTITYLMPVAEILKVHRCSFTFSISDTYSLNGDIFRFLCTEWFAVDIPFFGIAVCIAVYLISK